MSYLGIIVTALFTSNALLNYGFGSIPAGEREDWASFASAMALVCVNALAAAFLWAVHSLVLVPLRLASLDILFFAIIAVPLLKFLARVAVLSNAAANRSKVFAAIGNEAEDLIVGSLVFGVALVSTRSGFSLPEAIVSSIASGAGYWLSRFLLESIRERLELSDLPESFKGAPAMLLSAGLIAMAFMGFDAAFVKNLVG